MKKVLGRVLVIDDDPFMLKVICDLLEKAGFSVHVRDSPVGAANVILRERIDAAVIDWNLPTLQGDDVVRLLRTWDEVRDLPILLITGATDQAMQSIRDAAPGLHVLSKEHVRDQLVATLGGVVGSRNTVRGLQPVQVGKAGDSVAPRPRARATDLVSQLLTELAETLPAARSVWSGVARGEPREVEQLIAKLDRLSGQAQLLALHEAADLLKELCDTLRALPAERKKVPRDVKRAVEGGIAALSALPDSEDGTFTIPPEPLIGALRKAREGIDAR